MAWFNSSWAKRVKLTVQNTDIDSDLTDFPVYVDLSRMDATFWANVESDGADIRVTESDETTEVPVEVSIDTSAEEGFVYFKADPSSSTTTVFYLYYDNALASLPSEDATNGSENVWKSAFAAVLHLEEDPSGTAPQMLDSTSNDNDGTTGGSMATDDRVSAISHNGLDFDGSNDYVDIPDDASLDLTTVSVSLWFKDDGSSGTTSLFAKRGAASATNYGINYDRAGSVFVYFYDGGFQFISDTWTNHFTVSTWHHVVATFTQNGSDVDLEMYVDGVSALSGTISSKTLLTGATPLTLAATNIGASRVEFANVDLDEFRVASEVHSAAWIKAQHSAEDDNASFVTIGALETIPETAIYSWSYAGRTKDWTVSMFKTGFGGATTTLCGGALMVARTGRATNTLDDRLRAMEVQLEVLDPNLSVYDMLTDSSTEEEDFSLTIAADDGSYTINLKIRLDETTTMLVEDLEQQVTTLFAYCGIADMTTIDAVTLTSSTFHNLFRLILASSAIGQDIEYYISHYAENAASTGALLDLQRLNRLDLIFAEDGRKVDTMYDQLVSLAEGWGVMIVNDIDGKWHVKHDYALGESFSDRGAQKYTFSGGALSTFTLTGTLVTLSAGVMSRRTVKSPLRPVQAVQVERGNDRDFFTVDILKHGDYENGWESSSSHEAWELVEGSYERSTNADTGTYSFKLPSGGNRADQNTLRFAGGGQEIDIQIALRYALESDTASTSKVGTSFIVPFYENPTTLDIKRGNGGGDWENLLGAVSLDTGIVANGDPLIWTTLITTIYGSLPDFDGFIKISKQSLTANFATYFDTFEVRLRSGDETVAEFRAVSGRYDLNGNLIGQGGVVEQVVPWFNGLLGTDASNDGTRDEVIPMIQVLTTPAGSWVQASDFRSLSAGFAVDQYSDLFELTSQIRIAQQNVAIDQIEGEYYGILRHTDLLRYLERSFIQVYTEVDFRTEISRYVAQRKLIQASDSQVPTVMYWGDSQKRLRKATIDVDSAPWTAVNVATLSRDIVHGVVDEQSGYWFILEDVTSGGRKLIRYDIDGSNPLEILDDPSTQIFNIDVGTLGKKILVVRDDAAGGGTAAIQEYDYEGNLVGVVKSDTGISKIQWAAYNPSETSVYYRRIDTTVPTADETKCIDLSDLSETTLLTATSLTQSGEINRGMVDEDENKLWIFGSKNGSDRAIVEVSLPSGGSESDWKGTADLGLENAAAINRDQGRIAFQESTGDIHWDKYDESDKVKVFEGGAGAATIKFVHFGYK